MASFSASRRLVTSCHYNRRRTPAILVYCVPRGVRRDANLGSKAPWRRNPDSIGKGCEGSNEGTRRSSKQRNKRMHHPQRVKGSTSLSRVSHRSLRRAGLRPSHFSALVGWISASADADEVPDCGCQSVSFHAVSSLKPHPFFFLGGCAQPPPWPAIRVPFPSRLSSGVPFTLAILTSTSFLPSGSLC